jgi:Polyketide cyclase / dehydrase and lipid transport
MGVSAVTVADRGPPSSSDISPTQEPGPSLIDFRPRIVALALPSAITKHSLPGSPCRISTLPSGTSTSSTSEAIRFSSRPVQTENSGTFRSRSALLSLALRLRRGDALRAIAASISRADALATSQRDRPPALRRAKLVWLMSAYRQQAHLDAPLASVWELVGSPPRYPEWWPRVIEIEGERFEEGDEYVQVTDSPAGRGRTSFLLERREELREVRMVCGLTGTYAHWSLTEAQGGTFVDLEMGMHPKRIGDRLFDATFGRRFFSRWSEESLAALERAASRADAPRS